MKTKQTKAKVLVSLLVMMGLVVITARTRAGNLEPSAPPEPTMKTLDEVEPRIPIPASDSPTTPFSITESGSYYLTGDRNASFKGIFVNADNVTIDLMGFSLIGSGAVEVGIWMNAHNNVEICNGTIRGFGSHGIEEANVLGKEHRVINVRVVSNGRSGIILNGYGHLVKDCTVEDNSNNFVYIYDGIYAGYCSTVSDNIVYKNGGDGIRVADGCSVTGNTSCDNNGNGVQAGDGGTVAGNTVRLNFADGINVSSDCLVLGNNCVSNGIEVPNGDGAGVFADGDGNRIEGNNVIKNGRGIDIDGTGNIIIKNTASDNTDVTGSPSANYDIAVGNAYGQIINVAGGGGFINTDPTANFEF